MPRSFESLAWAPLTPQTFLNLQSEMRFVRPPWGFEAMSLSHGAGL